ncbi:unnamed protein product [Chrysoparadoxa australica]
MVVKTGTCSFSEMRVYPGHGSLVIRRDGQPITLLNAKCKSLLRQRKKPAKLTWTQAWRRLNKKIKVDEVARRRTRKNTKFARAIVGASLDEIKAKRSTAPKKTVSAAQAAALREAKKSKSVKSKSAFETSKAKPAASKQKGGGSKPARGAVRR